MPDRIKEILDALGDLVTVALVCAIIIYGFGALAQFYAWMST